MDQARWKIGDLLFLVVQLLIQPLHDFGVKFFVFFPDEIETDFDLTVAHEIGERERLTTVCVFLPAHDQPGVFVPPTMLVLSSQAG